MNWIILGPVRSRQLVYCPGVVRIRLSLLAWSNYGR
jgi:hypothetical protein